MTLGRNREESSDWRKIICSLWFLSLITTKSINVLSERPSPLPSFVKWRFPSLEEWVSQLSGDDCCRNLSDL